MHSKPFRLLYLFPDLCLLPQFEDESPLAVFYYCDHAVNQQMRALTAFMHHTPDNLGRRMVLIRHLKEAQHSLLNVIMSIVHDAIPDRVIPRDFHGKYPDDVVLDMISGKSKLHRRNCTESLHVLAIICVVQLTPLIRPLLHVVKEDSCNRPK